MKVAKPTPMMIAPLTLRFMRTPLCVWHCVFVCMREKRGRATDRKREKERKRQSEGEAEGESERKKERRVTSNILRYRNTNEEQRDYTKPGSA